MINDFQWKCFNLVYTSNIALILFLKCDVTKFRIHTPPPCQTMSHFVDPLPPLTCDVIYGWPLITLQTFNLYYWWHGIQLHSISCHTGFNMSMTIVFTAATISSIKHGGVGGQTILFMYPHKIKSLGVRSGDLGGHRFFEIYYLTWIRSLFLVTSAELPW